jgi:signal transduction histidine kinase
MALYFTALACNFHPTLPRILLFMLLLATHQAAAAPALDTVAKVRALTAEGAACELPVRIEATVIYYDPEVRSLFVSDDTACTYVATSSPIPRQDPPVDLQPGMRVRINGVTAVGSFFPIVNLRQIDMLGQGPLPAPRNLGEAELLAPALDSQWVEVPAVVIGVENKDGFTLAVEVYGRIMKAELPRYKFSAERAATLLQRPVRLQGIAATVFNTERQMTGRNFYVPSLDQIIPTDPPVSNGDSPLRAVNGLLRSDDTERTLVRVAGVVTQTDGNNFYLRDASGSLLVCTAGKNSLVAGDRVEAEGFAAIAPYRPIFRARKLAVTGHPGAPPPKSLDFQESQLPRSHMEFIAQDAEFLARRDGVGEVVLQCRIAERFFEAVLSPDGVLPEGLAPGDHVRLTGICELTTTHPFPRIEWVDGFRIHLPRAGGVVILRHAPWWTLEHLLVVLSIVSAVAFVALAWITLLRLRVKAQMKTISHQMQQAGAHEERQRIARDLHDTVEQELTGLSMELGCIAAKITRDFAGNLPDPMAAQLDQSSRMLDHAQKMLGHCRQEARVSIHNLRCIELEQRGLAGALNALIPPLAQTCGASFKLVVSGEPHPLEASVENHLLRIAQEGVTNAAKHAAPRNIVVRLDYQSAALTLDIHDDGCGFDATTPPPKGHYGLHGIRERSHKIQATLTVESAPGTGTIIRVVRLYAKPS